MHNYIGFFHGLSNSSLVVHQLGLSVHAHFILPRYTLVAALPTFVLRLDSSWAYTACLHLTQVDNFDPTLECLLVVSLAPLCFMLIWTHQASYMDSQRPCYSPTHSGFWHALSLSCLLMHLWLSTYIFNLHILGKASLEPSSPVLLPVGSTLTFDTGFSCRHFLFVFRLLSDFLPVVFLLPMGMRLESDIIRTYPSCDLCVSATLSFISSGLLSAAVGSLL